MAWEYLSAAISSTPAIGGVPNDDDYDGQSDSVYLFDAAGSGKCPWDLAANGSVGASDLLLLLVTWGPCADCNDCPADFDGDGTVGATDLLALLVNWGPCP